MELKTIHSLNSSDWDNLVLSFCNNTVFHSSAWARVLYETYNFTPLCFMIYQKEKLISLISCMEVKSLFSGSRCVSLPFSDFCEPLIDESVSFEDILEAIIRERKKYNWKSIEFRGGINIHKKSRNHEYYIRHTLELQPDIESIFASFRNSTRRNIKKAIHNGVTARITFSRDAVDSFYRLNCITRKHHGLPPQPIQLFYNIYEHIIQKNMGFFVLAYYKDIPIAGGFYMYFGNKAFFKYGASDLKYNHLRGNYYVMWKAINWFSKNGFKTLSFGRTDPHNKGLLQYKNGWGTTETTVNYCKYDFNKNEFRCDIFSVPNVAKVFFRFAPIPISKFIGSKIYRFFG